MDLVAVEEVRRALESHSERYLGRIYTEREVADCSGHGGVDSQRLAGRFAAKEAVIKLLDPDGDDGVPWRSIAVHGRRSGAPAIELEGAAAELAARRRITDISLSLAHERDCAGAVAIAEVG